MDTSSSAYAFYLEHEAGGRAVLRWKRDDTRLWICVFNGRLYCCDIDDYIVRVPPLQTIGKVMRDWKRYRLERPVFIRAMKVYASARSEAAKSALAAAPDYLTVKQAADLLKYHPQSVLNKIRTGRMPGVTRTAGKFAIRNPMTCNPLMA